MTISAQKHVLTAADIEKVKNEGFEFENLTNELPEIFINRCFPNFHIHLFLDDLNKLLKCHCSSPPDKWIILKDPPPTMEVSYSTDDFDLAVKRTFKHESDQINVWHDLLKLPPTCQKRGIGREVIKLCIQQYVNIGVRNIFIIAGLDVGGYAWARAHFTAVERKEVDMILREAETQLSDIQYNAVKRIYENYYTNYPTGRAFPIVKWTELPFMKDVLLGTEWTGTVDLQNNEQFTNFTNNVFK